MKNMLKIFSVMTLSILLVAVLTCMLSALYITDSSELTPLALIVEEQEYCVMSSGINSLPSSVTNSPDFHSIKRQVLSDANPSSYSWMVGNNPNICYNSNGYIVLSGTGSYSGRSYTTNLPVHDYFSW